MTPNLNMLRPLCKIESIAFASILILCLLDAFTTITIYMTGVGFELNPILRQLIEVNPFLVYPYLLSFLVTILLFRFNLVAELGVMVLLFSIHLLALVSNLGVILLGYSIVIRLLGGMVGIQFLAFLLGLLCVSGYSLYRGISLRETRFKFIRTATINYASYLGAYFVLNLISVAWLIVTR